MVELAVYICCLRSNLLCCLILIKGTPPQTDNANEYKLVRPDTMILHNFFSKLILTALVGILPPGRLTLAASYLQTEIDSLTLPNDDLAFLQQVTTEMSMVIDSARQKHAEYFPNGRFYTSHTTLDEKSRAYINAHHDYFHGIISLSSTFNLSHCELPPRSLETLQNWSPNADAPTLTFVRTILKAEELRAQQCTRLLLQVKRQYGDMEKLRLKLWNVPLHHHDLKSSFMCPTSKPLPTYGSQYAIVEAWKIRFSKTLNEAALFVCEDIKQSLAVFQSDMNRLSRKSWAAHLWRDSVLNYHLRITRLHNAQLDISYAAWFVAFMSDITTESDLPALTKLCKTLRDKAMGSPTPSRVYTLSSWAADHVDKWKTWSKQFQIGRDFWDKCYELRRR
jgi:hypothetical protein